MTKIQVLIADDHEVVRNGLRALLSLQPDLEIAGEAEDGPTAVALSRKLKPNVVLMDLSMPQGSGLEAAQDISRESPGSKVLVLSAYSDEDTVQKLMSAGAAGYLTKHTAAGDLVRAIHEVNRGHTFFSPAIGRRVQSRACSSFEGGKRIAGQARITARETQVLKLIAEGLCNKEIATELNIRIKTVEKHRQAIMDKLNIHDTASLTRYALSKGIVA